MDYQPSESPLLRAKSKLGDSAAARWALSKAVSRMAPYFGSIAPKFLRIEPGHVEARIRNRRSVQNHLKGVHAIAMCNIAEFVAGTCMEISLDRRFRWIPVGMQVRYQKIARSDLTAVCKLDRFDWSEPQDVVLPVGIFDKEGNEVTHADITMRISARK